MDRRFFRPARSADFAHCDEIMPDSIINKDKVDKTIKDLLKKKNGVVLATNFVRHSFPQYGLQDALRLINRYQVGQQAKYDFEHGADIFVEYK